MAANLDKAESSLSSVSDVAYLRAIDASGNSVKISKADLASVLGGFATPWTTIDIEANEKVALFSEIAVDVAGNSYFLIVKNNGMSGVVAFTVYNLVPEQKSPNVLCEVVRTSLTETISFEVVDGVYKVYLTPPNARTGVLYKVVSVG